MTMMATVSTTIRKDELDKVDELADDVGVDRAGVLRASVRYALDHVDEFSEWLEDVGEVDEEP